MDELTKKQVEDLVNLIEEAFMEKCGITSIKDESIDTTNWTKADFEREIEKRRQMIIANQNAFGIQIFKVKEES